MGTINLNKIPVISQRTDLAEPSIEFNSNDEQDFYVNEALKARIEQILRFPEIAQRVGLPSPIRIVQRNNAYNRWDMCFFVTARLGGGWILALLFGPKGTTETINFLVPFVPFISASMLNFFPTKEYGSIAQKISCAILPYIAGAAIWSLVSDMDYKLFIVSQLAFDCSNFILQKLSNTVVKHFQTA